MRKFAETLAAVRAALKPGGVFLVIDDDPGKEEAQWLIAASRRP